MRKLNKGTTIVIAAVLAGNMALLSGCGESTRPAAEDAAMPTIQEAVSTDESESVIEPTQSTETKTEAETAAETEISTAVETETGTAAETGTAVEAETKKEEIGTETQTESKPQEQTLPAGETAPAAEGTISNSDFAVIVRGVTIPIKGDMSVYTPTLGEPDEFGSARSCVEDGDDKVYTYGGTVIYTYITNGIDVISLIEITGGESLPSGIHIGSTRAEVIAAYGSAYTEEGTELLYEMGDKTIGLQMSGDTVSFIELF